MKRQPTKGHAHTAGYLVVVTLITLAIAEVAARLITEPGGASGKLGIVALVPLRPDANFIRQSLDGWYSHAFANGKCVDGGVVMCTKSGFD